MKAKFFPQNFIKSFLPILLVIVSALCLFGVKNNTKVAEINVGDVVAEEQVETTLTPDVENGILGLEKWENYADDSSIVEPLAKIYGSITPTLTISRAQDLATFAKNINSGSYTGSNVVVSLEADIDLSGKIWTPIGINASNYFKGTFYGNGHKITGVTIDNTITPSYKSLFGYSTGKICDLIVEGTYVVGNPNAKQIVAGGSPKLYNCTGTSAGTTTNYSGYAAYKYMYELEIKYPGGTANKGYPRDLIKNKTIYMSNELSDYKNYTVTKVEVQEHGYYGSKSGFVSPGISCSIDAKTAYYLNQIKFVSITTGKNSGVKSFAVGNYTGKDTKGGDYVDLTITPSLTHQSYFKVIITLDDKTVTLSHEEYAIKTTDDGMVGNQQFSPIGRNGFAYARKDDALGSFYNDVVNDCILSPYVNVWFTSIKNTSIVNRRNSAKLNSKITVSINNWNNISKDVGAVYVYDGTSYKKMENGSTTITITTENYNNLKIYICNITKKTLNNGKISFDSANQRFKLGGKCDAYFVNSFTGHVSNVGGKILLPNVASSLNVGQTTSKLYMLELYTGKNGDNKPATNVINREGAWGTSNISADTLNAYWCVKKVQYTLSGVSGLMMRVRDPNGNLGSKQNAPSSLDIYYTERLYVYDEKSQSNNPPINYYYTVTGTNETGNLITDSRDMLYDNKDTNDYLTIDKYIGLTYYAGIEIIALTNNGVRGTKYTFTNSQKVIKSAKITINGSVTPSEFTYTQRGSSSKTVSRRLTGAISNLTDLNMVVGNSAQLPEVSWTRSDNFVYDISVDEINIFYGAIRDERVSKSTVVENFTGIEITLIDNKALIKTGAELEIEITVTKKQISYILQFDDIDYAANPLNKNEVTNFIANKKSISITNKQAEFNEEYASFTLSFKVTHLSYHSVIITNASGVQCTMGKSNVISQGKNQSETITLTLTIDKYYKDGINITIKLKEILYENAFNIDVKNGTITNGTDNSKINGQTLKVSYRYLDTIKAVGTNIVTVEQLGPSGNKISSYTVQKKNDIRYTTPAIIDPKHQPMNNIGLLTSQNLTITYPQRDLKYVISHGYLKDDQSTQYFSYSDSLFKEENARSRKENPFTGNILKEGIIEKPNFVNLKSIRLYKNDNNFDTVAPISDTNKEYIVKDLKIGNTEKLIGENYLNGNCIYIDYIYEVVKYDITFKPITIIGGQEKSIGLSKTVTIDCFNDRALNGFVNEIDGYTLNNFSVISGVTIKKEAMAFTLIQDNFSGYFDYTEGTQTANAKFTVKAIYDPIKVTLKLLNQVDSAEIDTIITKYNINTDITQDLRNIYNDKLAENLKLTQVALDGQNYIDYLSNSNYVFNNFSNGKTEYKIYLKFIKTSVDIKFDRTFIGGVDVTGQAVYGSNTYLNVPTPTREGFKFEYWRMQKNGKLYTIYSADDSRNSVFDIEIAQGGSLSDSDKFYAYWSIDIENITKFAVDSTNTFEYDAKLHEIEMLKLLQINVLNYNHASFVWKYSKNGTDFVSLSNDKIFIENLNENSQNFTQAKLGNLKYVEDGGTYRLTFNFNYISDSSANNPAGMYYIITEGKDSSITVQTSLTVTPKTLSFDSEVKKVYDGTDKVNQNLTGICAGDTAKAVYTSKNVGTGINLTYSINNLQGQNVISNYKVPINKGTISPLEIKIKLVSGASEIYSTNSKHFVGSVNMNGNDFVYSSNPKNIEKAYFGDGSAIAWKTLNDLDDQNKVSKISFEIFTDKNQIGTYTFIKNKTNEQRLSDAENDLITNNILLNGAPISNQMLANFDISVEGNYVINNMSANQKEYIINAKYFDNQEILPIYNENCARKTYDGNSLSIIKEFTGSTQTLVLDFKNASTSSSREISNYWIKTITLKKLSGEVVSRPNWIINDSNLYSIDVPLSNEQRYVLDIVFDNKISIVLDYALANGETINGKNFEKFEVEYNSAVNLKTLTRTGFAFKHWVTNFNNLETKFANTTYNIKQNELILYAVWELNVGLQTNGTNITKVFDGQTTTVSPIGTFNNFVNNTFVWQYSTNGTNWKQVDNSLIANNNLNIRNVANNGYYGYKLKVETSVTYYGDTTPKTLIYKDFGTEIHQQLQFNITPKDIDLDKSPINMVFNGLNSLKYNFTSNQLTQLGVFNEDIQELSQIDFLITYNGVDAGSKISSITCSKVLNYNFVANQNSGQILKRQISLSIGDKSGTYVLNATHSLKVDKLNDLCAEKEYTPVYTSDSTGSLTPFFITENSKSLFKFVTLSVQTNNSIVGVYSGNQLIANVSIKNADEQDLNVQNLEITIIGSITIKAGEIKESDLSIVSYKVFNGELQNVEISKANNSQIPFENAKITMVHNGQTFNGAINAGTYLVSLTIEIDNYNPFNKDINFVIDKLYITLTQNTDNIYQREYNGDVNADLELDRHYEISSFKDKNKNNVTLTSEQIGIIKNIFALNNDNYKFKFANKDVANNKEISLEFVGQNENLVVACNNFKGDITKRQIILSLNNAQKVYSSTNFYVFNSNELTINNGVAGEGLSGGQLILNKQINAGVYNISTFEIRVFDYSSLKIGDKNLTDNYNIIGYQGNLTINKARIDLSLTNDELVYTGKNVSIKFQLQLQTNSNTLTYYGYNTQSNNPQEVINRVEFNLSRVDGGTDHTAVGKYKISFTLKDSANYVFGENSEQLTFELTFEVIKKDLSIMVENAEKIYDGEQPFIYTLKNTDLDGLCDGHGISDNATLTTRSIYVGDYYIANENQVDRANIEIKNSSNENVTSNYNIIYSEEGKLSIIKTRAEIITPENKTYNGETQVLTLNYILNNSAKTVTYNKGTEAEIRSYSGGVDKWLEDNNVEAVILLYTKSSYTASPEYFSTGVDFKYAGIYYAEIHSLNFDTVSTEILIKPKEISTNEIAGYLKDREYDATGNVYFENDSVGFTNTGIFDNDKQYVGLNAQYTNTFGTNNQINFTLSKKNGCEDKLFNSYVLSNTVVTGSITPRNITFTYIGGNNTYYTSKSHNLQVNDFEIGNKLTGENFSGWVTFETLKNADTYSLADKTATLSNLQVNNSNAELEHYIITFAGNFIINKTPLKVANVSQNSFTYDKSEHTVILIATLADDQKGELIAGIENTVLVAKYVKNGTTEQLNGVIDAGSYTIIPVCTNENYVYDDTKQFNNTLTINKREYNIEINQTINFNSWFFNEGYFTYELTDKDTNEIDKNKHGLSGSLKTQKIKNGNYENNYIQEIYTYGGTEYVVVFTQLSIGGLQIDLNEKGLPLNADGSVHNPSTALELDNYRVSIQILFDFSKGVDLEGIMVNGVKNHLTYNSQNQINSFVVEAVLSNGGTQTTVELTNTNKTETTNGRTVSIVGVYESKDENTQLTEIKDAGTYYVLVDEQINETAEKTSKFHELIIDKQTIRTFKLANGEDYVGDKIYDETNTVENITSNEIFNNEITIKATYNGNDAGSLLTQMEMIANAGGSVDNYALIPLNKGIIKGREITISLNSSISYTYNGEVQHSITADKFIVTDAQHQLVSGHNLADKITVSVNNVGTYQLAGLQGIRVKKGADYINDANYIITIDSNVQVIKRPVQIEWQNANINYSATDLKLNFVDMLCATNNDDKKFESEMKTAIKAKFNEILSITSNSQVATEIKNAGEYTFAISNGNVTGNNFDFSVNTSKNSVVVNKIDASIDFENSSIEYLTYIAKTGLQIDTSKVTGLYDVDKTFVEQIRFNIIPDPYIGQKYVYAEDDTTQVLENIPNELLTNYNFAISGDITLLKGDIKLDISKPTYAGKDADLFDQVVVKLDQTTLDTEKINPTDKFTFVGIEYKFNVVLSGTIKIEASTEILPKIITDIVLEKNKVYDGTNAGNPVTSADLVSGDDVQIIATYASKLEGFSPIILSLDGEHKTNYELNTSGLGGDITPKPVTVQLNSVLNYVYTYEHTYTTTDYVVGLVAGDEFVEGKNVLTFAYDTVCQNQSIADITTTNFEIRNADNDNVTACYQITYAGTINIVPRKFKTTLTKNANLVYDKLAKDISYEIAGYNAQNTLTDEEIAEIKGKISIKYVGVGNSYDSNLAPTDVGTYKATLSYTTDNYQLEGLAEITFEITQFTFEITTDNAPYFEVNEDDILTTILQRTYEITLTSGEKTQATLTFVRVQTAITVGYQNLTFSVCDNPNINIVCPDSVLENALYITPSLTKTLEITLNSFVNNANAIRSYGMANIEMYNLTDFNYTAKVGERTLTTAEITEIALNGQIEFNKGNASATPYEYKAHTLTSKYVNMSVATDLTLTINKRVLTLSLANGETYGKVFDGTITFAKEYALSVIDGDNSYDMEMPSVIIVYEDENIGLKDLLMTYDETNYTINLAGNSNKEGEITKLNIKVEMPETNFEYGELAVTNNQVEFNDQMTLLTENNENVDNLKTFFNSYVDATSKQSTSAKLIVGTHSIIYEANNFNIVEKPEQIVVAKKDIEFKLVKENGTYKEIAKVQDKTTNIVLETGEELKLIGLITNDVVNIDNAEYSSNMPGEKIALTINLIGADKDNYNLLDAFGSISEKLITIKFEYTKNGIPKSNEITVGILGITNNYYLQIATVPSAWHNNNGFDFLGWSLSQDSNELIDFTKPLDEIFTDYSVEKTVYAVWDIEQFTITVNRYKYAFETDGFVKDESYNETRDQDYDTTFDITPFILQIEHYSYLGYKVDSMQTEIQNATEFIVKKDITINLVYNLNKYTTTFTTSGEFTTIDNSQLTYSNNNKTITVLGYYGQKLSQVCASITSLLTTTKYGYTFVNFAENANQLLLSQTGEYAISGNVDFVANFTPNTYFIYIDANGGTFNLTTEQESAGWQYVNGSNQQRVQKEVIFDDVFPELVEPTKQGYTFDHYTMSNSKFTAPATYQVASPTSLVANYVDNDYTLTINAENYKKITVYKYIKGETEPRIEIMENTTKNFAVTTSQKVVIDVEVKDGYTLQNFTYTYGQANANKFTYPDFVQGDQTLAINITPNENTITVTLESGKGTIQAGTQQTTNIGESVTILALTDTTAKFNVVAHEGYEVERVYIVGNVAEMQITNNGDEYSLTGFVADVQIKVVFVPKDVQITINFANATLSLNSISHTGDFTTTVKVGTEVNFDFVINYGYELSEIEYQMSGSITNANLTGGENSGKYTYTFAEFYSDATITITIIKSHFTLTILQYEYDERTQESALAQSPLATVLVNNSTPNSAYEYLTQITTQVTYNTGFKLFAWYEKVADEMQSIVAVQNGEEISFVLEKDTIIVLVIQREEYKLTYTVTTGGYLSNGSTQKIASTSETIRYGRTPNGITAVAENYSTFLGWFVDDTQITTDSLLVPTGTIKDTTYIAKFQGDEMQLKVTIYTNTSRSELHFADSELQNIFTYSGNITYETAMENSQSQKVIATISDIRAYTGISFGINLPEWFDISVVNGAGQSQNTISINSLIPTQTTDSINYQYVNIFLKVKQFEVVLKTSIDQTVTKVVVHRDKTNFVKESVLLDANIGVAKFVVEYGANITLNFELVNGYMFTGATHRFNNQLSNSSPEFVFEQLVGTMTNIKADVEVMLNVLLARYRVNFVYNYEYEDISEFATKTYYINYASKTLENENGEQVATPNSFIYPKQYINEPYTFNGWNSSLSGNGRYNYLFDNDGIYRIVDKQKVYGFEYLINFTANNGAIDVTLYGIWEYDKYKIDVEFVPGSIDLDYSIGDIFAYTYGISPVYDDNIPRELQEIKFEVGSKVLINAPYIDGYTFYGWRLKDDTQISTGFTSLTMPAKAVTVVLVYAFPITVNVEQPIKNANNKATVNGKEYAEVMESETVTLVATPETGYNFVGWKVDGVLDTTLSQTATFVATKSATYTAVFEVKSVNIVVNSDEIVQLSKKQTQAIIGEEVRVYVDSVHNGYRVIGLNINGKAYKLGNNPNEEGIITAHYDDENKLYYSYFVTLADTESNELIIFAISTEKTIKVKFELQDNAGKVFVGGEDKTKQTLELIYGMEIVIRNEEPTRYSLARVLINGTVFKTIQDTDLKNFALAVNELNHIILDEDAVNIIRFEYTKAYWIDSTVELAGDGSKDNPYIIASAENLAYLAKHINDGSLSQSPHKYYKLSVDIDLLEKFWEPIGSKEHPFNGTFILNEKFIRNVYLDPAKEYEELSWQDKLYGVFGYIGEEAELVNEVSKLPLVLIIVGASILVLGIGLTTVMIFVKKNKKIKTLSKKISKETFKQKPLKIKKKAKEVKVEPTEQTERFNKAQMKELERMLDSDFDDITDENIEKVVEAKTKKKTNKKVETPKAVIPQKAEQKLPQTPKKVESDNKKETKGKTMATKKQDKVENKPILPQAPQSAKKPILPNNPNKKD